MKTTVGLDVGFGAFKTWGANSGNLVVAHVAESNGKEIDLSAVGLGTRSTATMISNHIGKFWVGAGATDMGRVATRLDYDRFTGSPEMRALFYAALGNAGILSRDGVNLVVGVPLGFVSGDNVKARIAALRGWMVGKHEWQEGRRERCANVIDVKIISQPHAAYMDYVLDINGNQNDRAVEGEVGLISIGFNTIEFMVMEDGKPSRQFAGGDKVGVRRLLESINASMGNTYSLEELDAKLRAGKLATDKAALVWRSEVLAAIERMWGESHRRFSEVIAVGGGVKLMGDTLRDTFGSTRLASVDDGVMSIARGLYKVGVMA